MFFRIALKERMKALNAGLTGLGSIKIKHIDSVEEQLAESRRKDIVDEDDALCLDILISGEDHYDY